MDGEVDKRSALIVAMLSSFFTPFMASSVVVALPVISDEFSMDAVLLSWVATAYLLAAAMFLLPFGRIADIKGRKKVFLYGMAVFTSASVLCAVSPSSMFLIVFRFLQGFGSAMIFGTSVAIVTSAYPLQERGKALGLTVAIVYLGLSVGPFFGGFLTSTVGWRSIFLVPLPLSAIIFYVTIRKLRTDWAEAKGEPFDVAGSGIYALSLVGVVLGLSLLPGTDGLLLLVLGAVGVLVFAYWEMRTPSPVLNIPLFMRNRAFALSNLAALINYSATFAVTFLMSLYLQYVRDYNPAQAGAILVAQPVVMAIFSPVAGKLSDLMEPRMIASAGMAITAIGLVFMSLFTAQTDLLLIIGCLAFIGFGFALFSSPNTNAIMCSVEKKYYGIAAATVGTMRVLGQVLSLGIAALFLSVIVGSVELSHELADEFLDAFQISFIVFAAMCFLGVLPSLARGTVRGSSAP